MSESTTAGTGLTSQYAAQVTSDLAHNIKEQDRISAEITALQERLEALRRDHSVLVNVQEVLGVSPAPVQPESKPETKPEAVSESAAVPAPRKKSSGRPAAAGKPARGKKTGSTGGGKKTAETPVKKATETKPAETPATKAAETSAKKTAETPAKKTAETSAKKPAETPAKKAADTSAKKTAVKAAAAKGAQPTLVELVRRHLTAQNEPRSAAEVTSALATAHPERGIKPTVVRTTLEGLVAKNAAQRNKQGSSVYYTAAEPVERTAAPASDA
ncbi:BlaI/MecI/CopY family transcriptional regulator [Streptomyces sp. NPDC006012]|uniref:BlaI/MecI/CopY family transcriptional regulator n=1 Tax=Streptomyces sp. NPDC006012 TaxID=3364739 RepID=UPI00369D9F0C